MKRKMYYDTISMDGKIPKEDCIIWFCKTLILKYPNPLEYSYYNDNKEIKKSVLMHIVKELYMSKTRTSRFSHSRISLRSKSNCYSDGSVNSAPASFSRIIMKNKITVIQKKINNFKCN